MKKVILLIIVCFNLLPFIKNGELKIGTNFALGQQAGGVYNGSGVYIGQGYGSSWTGGSNVYYYNGNSGIYSVYAIGTNPQNSSPIGHATLQGTLPGNNSGSGGGGGGEGYGDEDGGDDSGWDDGWDDLFDHGGGDGSGGGGQNLSLYDCNGDYNGNAYINACGECVGGRSQNLDNCGLPPKLYLQLNNYSTKYYDGDTIYVPKSNLPIKLTVIDENGLFDPNHTEWLRNDTSKCNNIDNCNIVVNERKITNIKVDSIGVKTLIECPLVVYSPPTIYFQKHNGYAGEYGFDDQIHKYYSVRNLPDYRRGYQVKKIHDDTAYYVPWMSLLHKQFANLKIRKVWSDSAWIIKDVNTFLTLKPTQLNIKINNTPSYSLNYSQLQTLTSVNIYAEVWNNNTDSLKLISPINIVSNANDTLGKLGLSCSRPKTKKVSYVFVNIGSGYDTTTLSRMGMINFLNENSHNQFMRKWNLNSNYPDTLDLTYEYSHYPAQFSNLDSAIKYLRIYYKQHRGIDIWGINNGIVTTSSSLKKHFMFITPILLSAQPNTTGGSEWGGVLGALFRNANRIVSAHEQAHLLNINHTFNAPYFIPMVSTLNFMDYIYNGTVDRRNWFSYSQWVDVF